MTKEQYLAIVASWKRFINDGKHKKYKKYYDSGIAPNRVKDVGYHRVSNLTACHHYIYARLCNKDVTQSFSDDAISYITRTLGYFEHKIGKDGYQGHLVKENIEKLKKPFGSAMTDSVLLELIKQNI